jgi:hypothetical protein
LLLFLDFSDPGNGNQKPALFRFFAICGNH